MEKNDTHFISLAISMNLFLFVFVRFCCIYCFYCIYYCLLHLSYILLFNPFISLLWCILLGGEKRRRIERMVGEKKRAKSRRKKGCAGEKIV